MNTLLHINVQGESFVTKVIDSFNHSDLLPLRYSISLVPRQPPEVKFAHD